MACINKLSGDIQFSCDDKPKKGIANSKAVIINYEDVDFGASTVSGATISNLALKSGATGYQLSWYKELGSATGEAVIDPEQIDGFGHSFMGRLSTTSANNAERARELKAGKFVVVYESKYQGATQGDAFKVLGFENGLELAELTTSTVENSGSILFTLSTLDDEFESFPYQVLLDVDYTTTKADFDALFAVVAAA